MDEFAPLLIILLIWVFVGLPSAMAKKVREQKTASKLSGTRSNPGAGKGSDPAPVPEKQTEGPRESFRRMQPTISVTPRDDSVYQGSLNAVTGEGFDPCHDEDLERLNAVEAAPPAQPVSDAPALPFGWTGSDIVRGVVISEILKKKTPARR
jgi:hypothetical protein